MTAFGGKSIYGLVESGNELFNRLITFWIKEHCVVRIGSSFHQLRKDLRLAGWWSLECGKAMCVLPASCKVPASLWWAAGGAGGQLLRWEMNSSRSKRQLAALSSQPLTALFVPRCPQSWQRSQLRRGFPRCKTGAPMQAGWEMHSS